MAGSKLFDTLREQHKKLTNAEFDSIIDQAKFISHDDHLLKNPDSYQRLVGRLICFITHPDICYVVQHLNQFMHSPNKYHMEAAVRVVKYLKSFHGLRILLKKKNSMFILVYCDSD